MVTNSVMPTVRPRSTMRTTGTPGGRSGSEARWSMPAPSEKIAFRFGSLANSPRGGCQTRANSMSAGSPLSDQSRNSSSGMMAAIASCQTSERSTSDLKSSAINPRAKLEH